MASVLRNDFFKRLIAIDKPTPNERWRAVMLACFFVPVGSLAWHLPGIGLDFTHPGAMLLLAGVAVVALVVGGLFAALGRHGYAPATALLSFLVADLHNIPIDALAIGLLGFGLARWKGVALLRLYWVMFAVVLVTALVGGNSNRAFLTESGPETVASAADLPPVIHVALDEVGPDSGLPADRYSLWSHAYSRYHVTAKSMPQLLGGFHDALLERGYSLDIWSNDYFDACRADAHCTRYWHHGMREAMAQGWGNGEIARLGLYSWLRSGSVTRNITNLVHRRVQASHTSPVTTMMALDAFIAKSRTLGPGEAMTIHALLPHYPFAYDADCTLRPPEQWVGRYTDFPIAERQAAHRAQRACVEKTLARLYRDDAVIVIHGDHGTRFFDIDEKTTGRTGRAEQLHQAFATLFAVHLPGVPARPIEKPASVPSLLEELAKGDFEELPTGRDESVFVGDTNFREMEMEF